MSDNLGIYNAVRSVPANAKKTIKAGRLSGKTDINPMWRLKTLTEQFGPCGFGWKYTITDKRLEHGANGEVSAFVDIDLFVNLDGKWSEAIPGTGGSAFVAKEKSGLYTSDECFKMALTDAISVACKALGFGADVYWEADESKYSNAQSTQASSVKCTACGAPITGTTKRSGEPWSAADIVKYSTGRFGRALCCGCRKKAKAAEETNAAGNS